MKTIGLADRDDGPQNEAQAVTWYRKAADDKGYPGAYMTLMIAKPISRILVKV